MAPLGFLERLKAFQLHKPGLLKLIAQRAQTAFLMAICVGSVVWLLVAATTASDVARAAFCELLDQKGTQSSDAEVSMGAGPNSVPAYLEGSVKRRDLLLFKLATHLVASNTAASHHIASLSGHFRPSTLIEMQDRLKVLSGTPPPALNG